MKRYDIEYQFVGRTDDEYDGENQRMEAVNESTLNRLKALFWVKILSVKPCKTNADVL